MPSPHLTVPLLMYDLLTPQLAEEICASPLSDPFGGIPASLFLGPRARWLFSAVLASLDLQRTDEIAILTTSQDVYVSICVSVPAFNYSRISRVVTETTKVVVVIHEFGYAFPALAARANEWRARGITIIEDCAHVVGLEAEERLVGSIGDYALFSLSKILPTTTGGLLRTKKSLRLPAFTSEENDATRVGRAALETYLPHYQYFSSRRRQRHDWTIATVGAQRIRSPSQVSIPFLTYVEKYDPSLSAQLRSKFHLAATLREDVWLLPTNPLVSAEAYRDALTTFQQVSTEEAGLPRIEAGSK